MKKILLILTALLTGFAFVSCEKPVEPAAPTSPIKSADLSIPAKGGSATITMEPGVIKKASTASEWLAVSVAGDVITASAEANYSIESRYATVAVETADETVKFSVMQYGYRTSGFSITDQVLTSAAKELSFSYDYDEQMVVTNSASWITVEVTEDALKLSVAEDATEATAAERQRTAELTWTLGAESGVFTVTQHHKNFMALDANWAVSYLGVQKFEGDDVEEVQNTVTDPAVSGPYAIYAMPKSDLGTFDLATYVEVALPAILKASFDEYIEIYASMGMPGLTYSDFYFEDTDFEIFDIFDPGEYYGIAIGLDENCEPTGSYQFCEFTKTKGEDKPSGYDAWLGDWKVNHGTSTTRQDTWTFSENVKDESFWITGIEGFTDIKVACAFDSATGGITVVAQNDVAQMEIGSSGMCSVGFYGALESKNFWTPGEKPYVIFTGTVSGDTATLNPNTIKDQSGDHVIEMATFIGTTAEGKFTLLHSFADATRVPATLTRDGQGGDEPEGSAAYKKFITTWQGTPAETSADPWVADFKQVEADKTVAIYGWEGWDEDWMAPISANFSSEDSSLTIQGGTGVPAAQNVDIEAPEGAMDIYFMGSVMYNGKPVVITSGTEMYDACKAVVDGTSLKITGFAIELEDGSKLDFVQFGLVAMDAATGGDKAIYTFKSGLGEFPYTLTKPTTSSIRMMGRTYHLSMDNAVRIDRSQMLEAKVSDGCHYMTPVPAVSTPAKFRRFLRN